MANVNIDVQLKVIGNGVQAIAAGTKELLALEKQAASASGSFKKIGETAAGVFAGNLLTKGFELAGQAVNFFTNTIGDAISAASAQEDAINRLNVALAASGNFSKEASQDLQEFANQLQATTKFEDDAILNTSALIATLTGLSGQGLKDATLATANLSAALGKDLDASAQIVSKALEGNVEALKRYGIEVKKGATDSETLDNVLKSLNNQFGGAAAGQVNTFSGSLISLKNTFGDLLEELGFAITQNPAVIAAFNAIKQSLLSLGQFIKDNSASISEFIGQIITFGATAATVTIAVIDPIVRVVDAVVQVIEGTIQIAVSAFVALKEAARGNIQGAFEALKAGAIDAATGVRDAFTGDSVLGTVGVELAKIEQASKKGFDALKSGASTSVEPVNALKEKIVELSAAQLAYAEQGRALASASNENAAAQFTAALEQERLFLEQGILTQEEFFLRQQELRQAQYDEELNQLIAAENAKLITAEQFNQAKKVQSQKLANDVQKIEIDKTKHAKEQEKQRAENFKSTLGTISSLQSSSSKELFAIGQAAAIATATIDGIAAVQKALASAPPPFNFALAALVGVATAANIGKIASQKPPGLAKGLTEVPGGFEGDTFPAFLNSGERVVSGPQNQDLKEFITDNRDNRSILESIRDLLAGGGKSVTVNIGGKEIVNILNDEIASGMVLKTG